MTARPRRLPRREHGFVLVGVIIFVLALTILALSLYGLSGFEAQFLEQNVAHDQAFYRAESGQELVKELLSQTLPDSSYYLQNAHKAIGIEGVVDATAWQMNGANPITAGLVDWSQPIYINVKAAYGGETRTVEGQFIGAPRRDPYQQLITSSNWIQYGEPTGYGLGALGVQYRQNTVTLTGRVWQDSTVAPSTDWETVVNWQSGGPLIQSRAPTPLATAFITQHSAEAAQLSYGLATQNPLTVTLNGNWNAPTFFTGPQSVVTDAIAAAFSLHVIVPTTVNVTGVCVWMFQKGVRFELPVQVQGSGPNPVLIIVASRNGSYQDQYGIWFDRALWFFETLDVKNNVTVYLVTDGVTDIEDNAGLDPGCKMNNLCIFTKGLWFVGPTRQPPGGQPQSWSMQYAPGMDALAQQLESMGALPASGGLPTSTFTLVPGSWREP